MTATYTFDVICSVDGFGAAGGDWTGYWGKQGPELLEHRLGLFETKQRMVFGPKTYRLFEGMFASTTEESEVHDPWVTRMWRMPATVISTRMDGPPGRPEADVVSGDAVDIVARLKQDSDVPLRSHGSLSMNRALMAAGLVDRLQVTLFQVITGLTGLDPVCGCRGLRPGAYRDPDPRRPDARTHLPTDSARLNTQPRPRRCGHVPPAPRSVWMSLRRLRHAARGGTRTPPSCVAGDGGTN